MNWYAQTEKLLKRYWLEKQRLNRLVRVEQNILNNIMIMKDELREMQRLPGMFQDYSLSAMPKARGGEKDLSNKLVSYETRLEEYIQEIQRAYEKLIKIRVRINRITEFLAPIDELYDTMTEELKKMSTYRYIYCYSNYQIGSLLNCSEKRIRNLFKDMIDRVAEMMNIRKMDATKPENNVIFIS